MFARSSNREWILYYKAATEVMREEEEVWGEIGWGKYGVSIFGKILLFIIYYRTNYLLLQYKILNLIRLDFTSIFDETLYKIV